MITNGGGLGFMTTDALDALDLTIPFPAKVLTELLRGRVPSYCAIGNPIDVVGDANSSRYDAVFEEAIKSGEYDMFVVGMLLQTPSLSMEITNVIANHQSQLQCLWVHFRKL